MRIRRKDSRDAFTALNPSGVETIAGARRAGTSAAPLSLALLAAWVEGPFMMARCLLLLDRCVIVLGLDIAFARNG